jgi:hypothetical protein
LVQGEGCTLSLETLSGVRRWPGDESRRNALDRESASDAALQLLLGFGLDDAGLSFDQREQASLEPVGHPLAVKCFESGGQERFGFDFHQT